MDITKKTLAEKLDLIASKVYVSIHYTVSTDSATRMYGLVSSNSSIIEGPNRPWDWPEDRAKKERKHVLWDAVLGEWLTIDYNRIKQLRFDKLETLDDVHPKKGWPFPEDLMNIDDSDLRDYNDLLLSRVTLAKKRFDELIAKSEVEFTDDEKSRYRNLFFRPDLSGEEMALCVVFKVEEIGDLYKKKLADVKNTWLHLIRRYRTHALSFLDTEQKEETDSEANEEIEAVKQLLRDIPQDNTLKEFKTINDVVSFWPVLLLPSPDFVATLQQTVKNNK
tara:strand:- start:419 stop:1252 length:834 start_codon:yes stop_codon:yes gene_type:complete